MSAEAAAIAAEEAAAAAAAQRSVESVDESGFPMASRSYLAGSTVASDPKDESAQIERNRSKARQKPQELKSEVESEGEDEEQGGPYRKNSSWRQRTGDF